MLRSSSIQETLVHYTDSVKLATIKQAFWSFLPLAIVESVALFFPVHTRISFLPLAHLGLTKPQSLSTSSHIVALAKLFLSMGPSGRLSASW